VGIAHVLEALDRIVSVAEAGIKVAHGIHHREVLGIGFQDFFVLGDGVLQLALLDSFLRRVEYLLLIEAKTKRHKNGHSRSCLAPGVLAHLSPRLLVPLVQNPVSEMDLATSLIVRLASPDSLVTKVYRKGVYKRGRGTAGCLLNSQD